MPHLSDQMAGTKHGAATRASPAAIALHPDSLELVVLPPQPFANTASTRRIP